MKHPIAGVAKATRDGYGEALVELGQSDPRVVVLSADLAESTRCLEFARQFPGRFIEVGVAEQNLAGIAAGMAMEGFTPFINSFAAFSPGRNWEQIRVSICYSNANVKIVGSHSGLSVGQDGATHQALEDIALMRVLPNLTVLVPADANQTRSAIFAAAGHPGPVYIRLTREETPVFIDRDAGFKIGKAQVVREGSDITIAACGPMVYEALLAADQLIRPGTNSTSPLSPISAEVINVSTIKPLDTETIVKSAKKTGRVVTVEDHQIAGGLGGAVAEALSALFPVPIKRLGVTDQFGQSGEKAELYRKHHLTVDDIVNAVREG